MKSYGLPQRITEADRIELQDAVEVIERVNSVSASLSKQVKAFETIEMKIQRMEILRREWLHEAYTLSSKLKPLKQELAKTRAIRNELRTHLSDTAEECSAIKQENQELCRLIEAYLPDHRNSIDELRAALSRASATLGKKRLQNIS